MKSFFIANNGGVVYMKNITMDKKLVWKRIVENIKEYLYIIFGGS